jgi:hypothetical protein
MAVNYSFQTSWFGKSYDLKLSTKYKYFSVYLYDSSAASGAGNGCLLPPLYRDINISPVPTGYTNDGIGAQGALIVLTFYGK